MSNPDLQSQTVEKIYSADIPSTPVVEKCTIRQITSWKMENDQPVQTIKFEINVSTPYYLSLMCDEEGLTNAINGLIWIRDNLPPVNNN